MDYSPFATQLLKSLWFVLPLIFLGAFLKSAWFKGRIGEWLVNRTIKRTLPKQDYQLFKDVTLPTEDGTTQIDHIKEGLLTWDEHLTVINTPNF